MIIKQLGKSNIMKIFCPNCGTRTSFSAEIWHCQCGEAFEPEATKDFNPEKIDLKKYGLWRYLELFGVDFNLPSILLGAGWTPLVSVEFENRRIFLKLEFVSPTGSFKDRGTELEINALLHQGVTSVIDDSSGNAGASLAAYAARAGIQANIFVPHYTSQKKKDQITVFGAKINTIEGPRQNTTDVAIAAVGAGAVYASHAYNPFFLLGQESAAWEIWEQLDGKVPDWYILPVGQGVNLLGAWLGFCRLKEAGLISKTPRMVAVQAKLINPIIRMWEEKSLIPPEIIPTKPSLAEGLAIAKPVRWKRILQAIDESDGMACSVDEKEIITAQNKLARKGFYVEPSSAVVLAALPQVLNFARDSDMIVMPLTGSGLKGSPNID
jgi:threonine synthase